MEEIQAAAERARLTVSQWVRLVLREARGQGGGPRHTPAMVRESTRGYAGTGRGASPSRSPVLVDDELLTRVMERYRFPTRDAAVHFALRRAADPPMSRDEVLAMRGTGWQGDLDVLRGADAPPDTP